MKKLLCILIAIITALTVCGCGKKTNGTPKNNNITVVNDYESLVEFDTMLMQGYLGQIKVNKDTAFVKNGKQSAKIIIDSSPTTNGVPTIFQAFESPKTKEDYTDFSNTIAISFDVYNAQNKTESIQLQLKYELSDGPTKIFTLNSGWNTVTLSVKREYIPEYVNEKDETSLRVTGMNICFNRESEDTVYYMDNMKLYHTNTGFTPIVMKLGENEISSFDYEWQTELSSMIGNTLFRPSVVMEKNIVNGGKGGAMKVNSPAGLGSYLVTDRWVGVSLNEDQLKLVPWAGYSSNAKLCFDVYVPETNGIDLIWLSMYSSTMRYYVSDPIETSPGGWITVSFSVETLNSQYTSTAKYNFANTTSIKIMWGEFTGEAKTIYFDNFRMEVL